MGYRIGFGDAFSMQDLTDALALQLGDETLEEVDITNASWGFPTPFSDDFGNPAFVGPAAALSDMANLGRGGLGITMVMSAGNEGETGNNVNYHNFQNSVFTISVGAIQDDGTRASFSTPGDAILVSAPGVGIVTTDNVGASGFVIGDFVSIDGTSFSAPIVAGVVGLMLEANPDLGARDVQEILAYSAVVPNGDATGWTTNGATDWNGGGL